MALDRQLSAARTNHGFRSRQRGGGDRRRRRLIASDLHLWRTTRCAGLAILLALVFGATVQAQTAVSGAVPVSIDIPTIGTYAQVVPLGEEDDGAMQAPSDPDTVGWYELGTRVGAPGNALLDGHVDWGGRLRVFGLLGRLAPGDAIQITDTDGNVFSYSVTWTRLYDADNAPLDQIFEQTTDEEVTLITCGGDFDRSVHMYVSRWVVRAVRSDASAD